MLGIDVVEADATPTRRHRRCTSAAAAACRTPPLQYATTSQRRLSTPTIRRNLRMPTPRRHFNPISSI